MHGELEEPWPRSSRQRNVDVDVQDNREVHECADLKEVVARETTPHCRSLVARVRQNRNQEYYY